MPNDIYTSYAGKRVIVTGGGGAGMGAATTSELVEYGAEVHVMDLREPPVPVAGYYPTDLRSTAAIDETLATIGAPVHSLFYCAGLPGAPFSEIDVMTVNFLSIRYMADRMLDQMTEGGAIVSISSAAGMGYMARLPVLLDLVGERTFDAGKKWCENHPELIANSYGFSKEALIAWTMAISPEFARRAIRVNCIGPGCTDTPMMPQFIANAGEELFANFPRPIENRNSTPEEQAHALIFLNSDAASYVAGSCLWVDAAFTAGTMTGQFSVGARRPD